MTKTEQKKVNKFLFGMLKHRNRRLVAATRFNKKAKPGLQLMVLPVKDILSEWKKLRTAIEGK